MFNDSKRMIDNLGNLRRSLDDLFLAGLSEDGNGNILFIKADSLGEKHIMLLIPSHTNQTIKSKIERIIDRSQEPG